MATYFVTASLKHDGREYAAGEKITLDETAAQPLLAAGVIGTESTDAAMPQVEQSAPEQTSADMAKVGGEESTTGEPALDGDQVTATSAPAETTPAVETSPANDIEDDPSVNL